MMKQIYLNDDDIEKVYLTYLFYYFVQLYNSIQFSDKIYPCLSRTLPFPN